MPQPDTTPEQAAIIEAMTPAVLVNNFDHDFPFRCAAASIASRSASRAVR